MALLRLGWQFDKNVPRIIKVQERCASSLYKTKRRKESSFEKWRAVPFYLSVPVFGYFLWGYLFGGKNSAKDGKKHKITEFFEYMAGDPEGNNKAMEQHLENMQKVHERHIIQMKIRDDEVLRPMQYDRFISSVRNRTTNDVDSGIDY